MRYIFSFIMIVIIFTTLFYLSMEETNAYSYRDIPLYFDSNYCKNLGFSSQDYDGCYYFDERRNGKKRNTIGVLNEMPENDLKRLLGHEYGEKMYRHTISDKDKQIWNKFYSGEIDPVLEKYNISTDTWNDTWRNYALNDKKEMFADLNAYYQTDREFKPMTKEWLANKWMGSVRNKYGISKEVNFDFKFDYWE